MSETKRGGPGRGQGRKPAEAWQVMRVVCLRLTDRQRAALERLGGGAWVRKQIDGIGNDIIAEREACAKVVESFIDPEIESNTAYEDQVVDGMLWQVIQAIRDRGHYAASLPPLTTTEFSGADRRPLE